jgi:hypothetical protein
VNKRRNPTKRRQDMIATEEEGSEQSTYGFTTRTMRCRATALVSFIFNA